ncbi:MAG: hypothetical protein CR974_01525 [Gammaproteobacteria bacterium]|nr:MAG: hypothetical protein CR974_01525 [Gammaproteobacteria bacterium]
MLTLQLPHEAENQLSQLARSTGKSTSEYIKETLLKHLATTAQPHNPKQQEIDDWVQRHYGMVKVNTSGQHFDLMNFDAMP